MILADKPKPVQVLPLSPRKPVLPLSPRKQFDNTANIQAQPLSPRKQFDSAANIQVQPLSPRKVLGSPLKLSAAKSSPAKLNVKGFSVKKALEENSPVKRSPVMKLHRQEG